MKVKPQMIEDDFMYDRYLGCPNCKEAIHFPLIRNPEHIYDHRPHQCKKCGVFFDWSGHGGNSKVYHPSHYNIPGKKECWDEMVERFGVEATKIFCKLNSFKYLYRHEEKNGQEDIEKAANYKNKYLELGGTEKEFEEGMNGYELSQYNTQ